MYADDTQMYAPLTMSSEDETIERFENCVKEVKDWMTINKLKLNDDKTEVLLCATESRLKSIDVTSITIADTTVPI